jgi:hypothetical protein
MFFEVDERWLQQSLRRSRHCRQRYEGNSRQHGNVHANRAARHEQVAIATLDALSKAGFFALPTTRNFLPRQD